MNPEVSKSLSELRQLWKPEAACLTCASFESNYMTEHGMGHCQHDPAWTSRAHNGHCQKHETADNAAQRVAWWKGRKA